MYPDRPFLGLCRHPSSAYFPQSPRCYLTWRFKFNRLDTKPEKADTLNRVAGVGDSGRTSPVKGLVTVGGGPTIFRPVKVSKESDEANIGARCGVLHFEVWMMVTAVFTLPSFVGRLRFREMHVVFDLRFCGACVSVQWSRFNGSF